MVGSANIRAGRVHAEPNIWDIKFESALASARVKAGKVWVEQSKEHLIVGSWLAHTARALQRAWQ